MDPDKINIVKYRAKLKKLITGHFTLSELKTLCFDLGIPHENIPGTTLEEKSVELIAFCERNGNLENLINELRIKRPHVDWPVIRIPSEKSPDAPDQHSPTLSQQTAAPPKKRKRPETPLLIILFVNIIIFAVILALIIALRLAENIPFIFCGSDTAIAYGLSILTILVMHFLWRIISPALDAATDGGGAITLFGSIAINIGAFQSIIDALHPWKLSDRVFWPATIIGTVITAIGLIAAPINSQASPTLAHFSILIEDSAPSTLSIGTPLKLQRGQKATIEAAIGKLKGVNCSWKSVHGVLIEVDGCKVSYIAPQFVGVDFLEIKIASSCSRYTLLSGLVVNISDHLD
jgi:hypothetical protein